MSFLQFALVFADKFLAMHIALSPNLSSVHPPLSNTGSMASKRVGSQDTNGNATGATVEQVSSSLPIYEDTKLYLDRDIKLNSQEVNETFAGIF